MAEETPPVGAKPVDSVVYRYNDASVPPSVHRSDTITATPNQAHKVVDSYGDLVAEMTVALTSEQWTEVLTAVDTASFTIKPDAATVARATAAP